MSIGKLQNGAIMKLPDCKTAQDSDPSFSHAAGWIDLVGVAVMEGAPRIQRIHLQIAETLFRQVNRFAPAQPVVYATRTVHSLVSGISYGMVSYSGASLSWLARRYFKQ